MLDLTTHSGFQSGKGKIHGLRFIMKQRLEMGMPWDPHSFLFNYWSCRNMEYPNFTDLVERLSRSVVNGRVQELVSNRAVDDNQ